MHLWGTDGSAVSALAWTTDFLAATVAGYEMGRRAEPLFGADWPALLAVPLDEVRTRFAITGERRIGEGIRGPA